MTNSFPFRVHPDPVVVTTIFKEMCRGYAHLFLSLSVFKIINEIYCIDWLIRFLEVNTFCKPNLAKPECCPDFPVYLTPGLLNGPSFLEVFDRIRLVSPWGICLLPWSCSGLCFSPLVHYECKLPMGLILLGTPAQVPWSIPYHGFSWVPVWWLLLVAVFSHFNLWISIA